MFTYTGSGGIIYFYAQGKERMKHIALILIIGCVGFASGVLKWETITNTTHIYDLLGNGYRIL